jgi:hypothetical protein
MIDSSAPPDPPLGFPDPPRSRLEFWVRFVFGFFFGVLLGTYMWVRVFFDSWGLLALPICGIVAGMSAAKFGDRFWTWFRWRQPWW